MPNPTVGDYPIQGVAQLPNVTVAYPGERWTNRRAVGGPIMVGAAVVPVNNQGQLGMRVATDSDPIQQMALATRTVDVPDQNTGPASVGPNEIKNQNVPEGEYLMAHYSGVFHLTVATPLAYLPSDLVFWDFGGTLPAGKTGPGAWTKATDDASKAKALFEVMEFRPYTADKLTGVLTVRSLRGQF